MSKNRKLLTRIFACFLALSLMAGIVLLPAHAAEFLPEGIYLTQAGKSTCTLCSATMMIRSRMYLSGNSDWSLITESGVRSVGWIEGTGLRWNFTYSINGSSVTVGHEYLSGVSISALKALLDTHTEGIVLYCGKLPHAVFLTDYEGDTFYCAETVAGYSGKRIPLASSYLAKKYGTQADVLSKVTAYWYVASYSISENGGEAASCNCSASYAATYICTTTDSNLRIRSGHGTNYSAIGNIPPGQTVYVSKSNGNWAHVEYNGISGYASMAYLQKQGTGHAEGPTVSWWLSNSAYGEAVEEFVAGQRYYFCYRLYDSVTGESWDEVKNSNYSVKLTYYNQDGSVKYANSGTFDRDEGWISDFFGEAGAYKIGITIDGDYPFSASRTFAIKENPILVHSSAQQVDLALNGTLTQVAHIWTSGYYSGKWSIAWKTDNDNVTCAWGEWTEEKTVPLTLTAKAAGTTTVTVFIKDRSTGDILDQILIHVNVHKKQYNVRFDPNGGTNAPESQLKYQDIPLTLSSAKPLHTGYTFLGWSTDPKASNAAYQPGDSFKTNSDTTLYALWKKGCEDGLHEYESTVTAPSFSSGGYTTHTCTICGDSYTDTPTEPLSQLKAPSISKLENKANGIRFSWNAVDGAESYRIFMKVDGGWKAIGTTSGTAFTWTGAVSGQTYTFTMRCMTADGKAASGYDRTGWKHQYIAQPKISGLENKANGVMITWEPVAGAANYKIVVKTATSEWKTLGCTSGTSFTWPRAASGVTYTFGIRCVTADGKAYTSSFDAAGKTIKYVARPTISTAESTKNGVKLTWEPVAGAVNYKIVVKTATSEWKTLGCTSGTSFTWPRATSGVTYTFGIRCVTADGKTYTSAFDAAGKTLKYIAQPAISSLKNTDSGIKLTWEPVAGAVNYKIVVKTASSGWKTVAYSTGSSFTWTGAAKGENYTFSIRCVTADGKTSTSSWNSTGWTIQRT